MAAQRFSDLHIRPGIFVVITGYAPVVPPLRPLHIFFSRVDNLISDSPSRSSDLTDNQLFA